MKIEIRNFAGNWESLTCDCGGDEFVAFQEYEKDGETITDFECVRCHEGPHFVGSDGWREVVSRWHRVGTGVSKIGMEKPSNMRGMR